MSLFQTVTGPISTYPQRGFPWQRNETEKKIDTQKAGGGGGEDGRQETPPLPGVRLQGYFKANCGTLH